MFKRNALTAFMGLMLITSGLSFMATAQDGGTLYVGTTDTNNAVTYDTVQNAVANASDGDTIQVANGEYTESIEVNTPNLTIEAYASTSPSVTINATGEPYGDAFYGSEVESLSTGSSVTVQENQVYVGTSDTATESTYSQIQYAIDNSSANTTIVIAPGTYEESLNVTTNYLAFTNYNASAGNVTIDATNTTSGDAFRGEYADNVRVGQSVVAKSETFFGGGFGNTASKTFMGVPYWAIGVLLIVVAYLYYDTQMS